MSELILTLLDEYLTRAQEVADQFRRSYRVDNVLSAVNSGQLQREGDLAVAGLGHYYIHGSGCRYESVNLEIDFDFGPDGAIPGADPWKLYNYADTQRTRLPWLTTRSAFKQQIETLVEQGVLQRVGEYPSPDLLKRAYPIWSS